MSAVKCMFAYVLEISANSRCQEHTHDCCEIAYCIGTDGVLVQDGQELAYHDGSIFVYQPGGKHMAINQTGGQHICIGVVGSGVAGIPPGVWYDRPQFRWLFDKIAAAARSDSPLQRERLDYLSGLVTLELRELLPDPHGLELAPALKAKAIIDESFTQEIDIAALARLVYLSPDYLRHQFKLQVGQSAIKYLIGKRIEYAKSLLQSSATPIHIIASECGFLSPYYFSRLFKQVTGESPKEFRSRLK